MWSVSFAPPQEIFPCEQMNLFILLVISFDVIFCINGIWFHAELSSKPFIISSGSYVT